MISWQVSGTVDMKADRFVDAAVWLIENKNRSRRKERGRRKEIFIFLMHSHSDFLGVCSSRHSDYSATVHFELDYATQREHVG
jgi:hypothetical protein